MCFQCIGRQNRKSENAKGRSNSNIKKQTYLLSSANLGRLDVGMGGGRAPFLLGARLGSSGAAPEIGVVISVDERL